MNLAILKKDLRLSLLRPSLLFLFSLVSLYLGVQYFYQLGLFSQMVQKSYSFGGTSLLENLWAPFFGQINMILLFVSPFVVSKAFGEEQRQDAMLSLLASPLSSLQIVFQKFLAGWIQLLLLCSLVFLFPIFSLLMFEAPYLPELFSGYLALVLLSAFYTAIALFAGSLFKSFLMSGIFSVLLNIMVWSIGIFFRDLIQFERFDWVESLWIGKHLTNLFVANLSLNSIYFFVAGVFFFLFLSYQMIEQVERG